MTSPCSEELLESALAGDLPLEREQLLHRHLEECQACTTSLERMAGGADLWREAAVMFAGDELDDALSSRDEWSNVDFTVEHLEPADEPGVLGRLGGYDVLEIIGRGGMGVVLKGFDPELKRCVAIKVLSPHLALSSLARKRFAREAQAAAAVVHANVLAIHQVQPAGRLPFLVMPLVAGESLAQRLTAQGRLELKEVLRVGMQAAAGLSAAHEQGLVHRDVKPANILLEKGVERAVLTDFGLARAADDVSMTRWGIIAGTPQYMSPEQARGEPVDGRSDLFSLGCVLYEMATGVSPFRADSTLATLRRLIDDPPPAMASHDPELPPWFIGIVERLLEKEPSKRFGSAKEVSELLEGCLAHLQQPASVPLPADLPMSATRLVSKRPRTLFKRFIAMIATLGIVLLGMVAIQATSPPDISGNWQGEDWGQVTLTQTAPGEYTGTYTDTVAKEKGPGKIDLKWSRIERRYNGTWREGDDDRFGTLSVHLVGKEIRGALTTSAKSKINPATPRLAELAWTPAEAAAVVTAEQQDLVRVTAIPALEPMTWQWKVHLPKGRRFGWQVAYGDILANGFRKTPWGCWSNESYWETGLDAVLTAALRRQNDGNWAMTVNSKSLNTKELFGDGSVAIPKEALRPLFEAGGKDETFTGRREVETFNPELPVTLLMQTAHGGTSGFAVWLEPWPPAKGKSTAGNALAGQRIVTQEVLVQHVEVNCHVGDATMSDLCEAQDRLVEAELAFAGSKRGRIAIWEKLLKKRQEMEKEAEEFVKSGIREGALADFPRARAARQKAEIGLAEEKARNDSLPIQKSSAAKKVNFGAEKVPGTVSETISDSSPIRPLDVLQIRAADTLPDEPIDGYYGVEPDGNVALGPTYGRVNVNGLNVEQAEAKIVEKLKAFLKSPKVQVTIARANPPWQEVKVPRQPFTIEPYDSLAIVVRGTIPGKPILNCFTLSSDGSVALGPEYGRVPLKGLTLEEAEQAIAKKLREVLKDPKVYVALPLNLRPAASPKAPYAIKPNDLLCIVAVGVPSDEGIGGIYAVGPRGTVALGPWFGRVNVQGLSLEAAEKAIQKKLQEFVKAPVVSVTVAGWSEWGTNFVPAPVARLNARHVKLPSEKSKVSLPTYRIEPPDVLEIKLLKPLSGRTTKSITGQYLVGPDGTVNLRQHGQVALAGKTVAEARTALEKHLAQFFDSPEVTVDVASYNSKAYYVITQGPNLGDIVHRFPVTGNETVLDAVSQIDGLSNVSSKKMWISRPAQDNFGKQKILSIDWDGIAQGARTETNYQLLPGDRLFISDEHPHPHAVQFDGRHYAKVEPSPKFTSGDFTISLWFNPVWSEKAAYPFMRGLGYRDQRGDIGLMFHGQSGELAFDANTGGNSRWLFGWDRDDRPLRNPVDYGWWNHVVVTRRSDIYAMWMNGTRVGREKSAADISDADNTNPFLVGGYKHEDGTLETYRGLLDDFRIFRRCLSDKEIADLFKSNGDETALKGEGCVKIGPLIASQGDEKPITPSTAPKSSISTQEALDRVGKAIAPAGGAERVNRKENERSPRSSDFDFSIVVAKHVMLLDGREIVTWPQIEEKLAKHVYPSPAHPGFYDTRGALDAGLFEPAQKEMFRLKRDYKFAPYGAHVLSNQASFRYDRIHTPADLKLDESARTEGIVVTPEGKPVANAEVVLVTPIDKSIPYSDGSVYQIQLEGGRVNWPLDHVITRSDAAGRFTVYPPKGQAFSIVALHPDAGIALPTGQPTEAVGAGKTPRKLTLAPWAGVNCDLSKESENQDALLRSFISLPNGLPTLIFDQSMGVPTKQPSTLSFHCTRVPPGPQTVIHRVLFGWTGARVVPVATVELLPGETRQISLGPVSKQQRELLQEIHSLEMSAVAKPAGGAEYRPARESATKAQFEARLPSGVTVELYGVAENPSKDHAWWRPDGAPLDKRPYETLEGMWPAEFGKNRREFAILLKHLPAGPTSLHLYHDGDPRPNSLPPINFMPSCLLNVEGEPDPNYPRVFRPVKRELHALVGSWPAKTKTATIRIGVGSGQWRTVGDSAQPALGETGSAVLFSKPEEKDGNLSVTVTHAICGDPPLVVAVDAQGNEHLAKELKGGVAGQKFAVTATFAKLSAKEVKAFRLQTQVFDWVEFRNVSLFAGEKTNVQVVQPSSGGSPPTTHKVVDGDSLASLADRYLGSSSRAMEIYEANRNVLTRSDVLPIGAELKIPQTLKGQDLPDLQVAQARFDAAKSKADDDTGIRYAEAAAEVAKREYEYNKATSAKTPGSVPIDKLLELSLKCTEMDLAIELAKLNKRLAGEDLTIAKAELTFAQSRRRPLAARELAAAEATRDAAIAEAKYNAAHINAGNDINIRYAAAAAAVRKADCDFNADAEKKVPGSVPKAKLDDLLLRSKEADLAVEKAKRQQQAEVEAARIAKAELDAARRRAEINAQTIQPIDKNTIIAALKRRQAHFHSGDITWSEDRTKSRWSRQGKNGEMESGVHEGVIHVEHERFAFDGEKKMYYETAIAGYGCNGPGQPWERYISTFNGREQRFYWPPGNPLLGHADGTINGPRGQWGDLQTLGFLPIILACRPLHPQLCDLDSDDFALDPMDAMIDGHRCAVLKASETEPPGEETYWLDRDREWVIVKYQRSYRRCRGHDTGQTTIAEVSYQNDAKQGWLPSTWRTEWRSPDTGAIYDVQGAKVVKYAFNEAIPHELFDLPFPPGTFVDDNTKGNSDVYWVAMPGGRKHVLTEAERKANVSYEELMKKEHGKTSAPK